MNNSYNSEISLKVNLISGFISNYGISIIGLLGVLINIFVEHLLQSKTLKHDFYRHINTKATIDIFVSLIAIEYFYNNACEECKPYFRYEIIIFQWFVKICTRLAGSLI